MAGIPGPEGQPSIDDEAELLLQEQIDTLRREIGRGGMGVVYEAWENSMDRAVALKVLPSHSEKQ